MASPYINYPLALADILAPEGGITDAGVIAAALLHDTVEDTETTMEELADLFGKRVAGIVAEVTDDKSLPKEERKRLQIVKSGSKSDEAKLVKLADKIANLRDISSSAQAPENVRSPNLARPTPPASTRTVPPKRTPGGSQFVF